MAIFRLASLPVVVAVQQQSRVTLLGSANYKYDGFQIIYESIIIFQQSLLIIKYLNKKCQTTKYPIKPDYVYASITLKVYKQTNAISYIEMHARVMKVVQPEPAINCHRCRLHTQDYFYRYFLRLLVAVLMTILMTYMTYTLLKEEDLFYYFILTLWLYMWTHMGAMDLVRQFASLVS